jgi:hypothetical protein
VTQLSAPDPVGDRPLTAEDPIVMVPVPRSRLADVYAALGRGANGDAVRWQPIAAGVLRSSWWVSRKVVRPARGLGRQDLGELGENLAGTIERSARRLFSVERPPRGPDEAGPT